MSRLLPAPDKYTQTTQSDLLLEAVALLREIRDLQRQILTELQRQGAARDRLTILRGGCRRSRARPPARCSGHQLIAHSQVDTYLAAAIGTMTTKQIGKRLRGLMGRPCGGFAV